MSWKRGSLTRDMLPSKGYCLFKGVDVYIDGAGEGQWHTHSTIPIIGRYTIPDKIIDEYELYDKYRDRHINCTDVDNMSPGSYIEVLYRKRTRQVMIVEVGNRYLRGIRVVDGISEMLNLTDQKKGAKTFTDADDAEGIVKWLSGILGAVVPIKIRWVLPEELDS